MLSIRTTFGALVFLAAFLIFAVEPMAAKQLLPALGGASAVWVTCLVFFQTALLVGYLYSHWMAHSGRWWAHLLALGAALVVLGLQWGMHSAELSGTGMHGGTGWSSAHPVRTIFAFLSTRIGLPFLVLAATSPLLQVWWVRLLGGSVPYGLFALSNAGSLLGLILYPAVIEPHLTLGTQSALWIFGFALYAVGSAWVTLQVKAAPRPKQPLNTMSGEGLGKPRSSSFRRWMWFMLPMGAAMQLAAVTSHLSQDVAAIPMLWVVPLGVYLLTFILAFELPGLYRRWFVARVLAVLLASLGYALSRVDTTLPLGLAILFYMVELLFACWFCHAEAYRLKPVSAEESTLFYLIVAAGGAAGTFFVAVASPAIFRANYDLAVSFAVTAVLAAVVTWSQGWPQRMLWVTGSALLFALVIALHIGFGRHALLQARNFYGSLRVTESQTDTSAFEEGSEGQQASAGEVGTGPVRTLMNGRIRHGTQMQQRERRGMPTTYYGPDSGIGIAIQNCCDDRSRRIGVVGLGVGTIAAYGRSGDRFRFYEINPLVEPIARNLFTYLHDTPSEVYVAEGDGRALLQRDQPQGFDVLAIDAFSGDAIPLHLLTREAMRIYQRQISPTGVLAFHVSNSYLDLAPEIALLAASIGMQARRVDNFAVPANDQYRSTWVLVSADPGFFAQPAVESASEPIASKKGLRLWTDEYSSLLPVMRWGRSN